MNLTENGVCSNGNGYSPIIYLDNNATTMLDKSVVEAMIDHLNHSNLYGNASSSHSIGKRSREMIDECRRWVGKCINAKDSSEIIFTSGGTESNNLAINGVLQCADPTEFQHVITTPFEHPSVENVLKHWKNSKKNIEISQVKVDSNGIVDLEDFTNLLREETKLVTIMHSNNEIGSIQPIEKIVEICRKSGRSNPIVHTDASQSIGKIRVDVELCKVDLLTICSHKFHGPKGIGALFVRRSVELKPSILGASHERSLRPGTENILAIRGLAEACRLITDEKIFSQRTEQMRRTRDRLYSGLIEQFENRTEICFTRNGNEKCLPNTLNLSFKNLDGKKLVETLKSNLAFSTGSACHEDCHSIKSLSSTLRAIGLSTDFAFGTLRLSTSFMTTDEEIDRAVFLLRRAIDEQIKSNFQEN